MISAVLLVLAGLSGAASAADGGGTVRHMKGHSAIPAGSGRQAEAVPVACNPDPLKGRACRHHQAKAEERRNRDRQPLPHVQ